MFSKIKPDSDLHIVEWGQPIDLAMPIAYLTTFYPSILCYTTGATACTEVKSAYQNWNLLFFLPFLHSLIQFRAIIS